MFSMSAINSKSRQSEVRQQGTDSSQLGLLCWLCYNKLLYMYIKQHIFWLVDMLNLEIHMKILFYYETNVGPTGQFWNSEW